MRDLRQIEQGAEKLPPLQRSRFVDGSRYRHWTWEQKHNAERRERLVIRSGGQVGTPGCNIFAMIQDGPEAETIAQFVVDCRTDVPSMAAQIRADDDLLLAVEWSADVESGVNKYGEVSYLPACPCCGQSSKRGHSEGCNMKLRCDEARARKAAVDE